MSEPIIGSEKLKEKFFDDLVEVLGRFDCVEISNKEAAEVIWKEIIDRAIDEMRENMVRLNRYEEGPLN